jgi:hypothetical protein
MKKILSVVCMVVVAASVLFIGGCKDEFNIPEIDYVDSLPPAVKVLSPTKDTVITGQTAVPIIIELSDDYELNSLTISIAPTKVSLAGYTETIDLSGKKEFTFTDSYTLPTTDSMTYEVNIAASDLVNNKPLPIQYFFTTK